MRSLVNVGRDSFGRLSPTRAAGLVTLLLMVWFVLTPQSLGLVWGIGYAAIIAGFLYRQWAAASPYMTHEPSRREIVSVLTIAAAWTVTVIGLYIVVRSIRFVGASILGLLGGAFGS